MTKRDFELIAATLRHELEHVACGEDQRDMARSIIEAFATALARTNPRFDHLQFLEACGVES